MGNVWNNIEFKEITFGYLHKSEPSLELWLKPQNYLFTIFRLAFTKINLT